MTVQFRIQGTHDQPTATKIRETLELTASVLEAEVTANARDPVDDRGTNQ